MAKITSRQPQEEIDFQALKDILFAASDGFIGDPAVPSVQVEVASDFAGLTDQLSQLFTMFHESLRITQALADVLQHDLIALSSHNNLLKEFILDLSSVSYDDALDHAAEDLMDSFGGSGLTEINADGSLVFEERATFKKEDIKPILRDAINCWISIKLQ
jgi:hypothetical protein